MKYQKIQIARAGVVDRELLPIEELFRVQKNIKDQYIPYTLEHDIRNPPIGRITSSEINQGILYGIAEIFEESDKFSSIKTEKSVKIHTRNIESFEITCKHRREHSTRSKVLQEELAILASNSLESRKYSAELQDLIVVTFGVFAISNIAGGFFKKLGSDIYDVLKQSLKKYFNRKPEDEVHEELLQIQYLVKTNTGRDVEINIVITNPSEEDINQSFTSLPNEVEELLEKIPVEQQSIVRIVLSYKFPNLEIIYLLRSDCVPLNYQLGEK